MRIQPAKKMLKCLNSVQRYEEFILKLPSDMRIQLECEWICIKSGGYTWLNIKIIRFNQ